MNKDAGKKYETCSVVMAVYHADKPEWFCEAIDSILNQTVKSNDIVIVRDGPVSDELESVLCEYEKGCQEVRIIRLEKNGGLGNALNIGIKEAKNELIARMDADDISVGNRFELQLVEFNKDPELTLLGGQIAEFEGTVDNIVAHRIVPTEQEEIIKFSKRRNPFNHVTVMYKKGVIDNCSGYDEAVLRCEDYDLWMRVLSKNYIIKNLAKNLVYVRIDQNAMKRRGTVKSVKGNIKCRSHFHEMRYISRTDFMFGMLSQVSLLIIPASIASPLFKVMRKVDVHVEGEDDA